MANELRTTYTTSSATVYAIIRRVSDMYVWNGSTWETWADANIANYDVAITDQGGDTYSGDFPTSITAGNYYVTYYIQAGAAPATTDNTIESVSYHWDGADLSSTSTVTISAYALCSLASLKRYLGISSSSAYDTLLTELINAYTDRIERECGRKFKARDYTERFTNDGTPELLVTNWPIIEVTRLAYGDETALTVGYTGSGIRATVEVNEATVICRSWVAAGTQTENSLSLVTYPTASTLAAAIEALTDWTATCERDCLSTSLSPKSIAVKNAFGTQTAYLTYADEDFFDYWADRVNGIIKYEIGNMDGADFQNILLEYRAGYETIPDDLAQVCIEAVASAWRYSTKDPSVTSERLGDYAYTLAEGRSFTDAQRETIARWRAIR